MELVIKLNAEEEQELMQRLFGGLPAYEVDSLKPYLTIDEACEVANISRTCFYENVKPEIGVVKIGGKSLVDSRDLVAYLNSNKEYGVV